MTTNATAKAETIKTFRFASRELAFRFADHSGGMAVMLGDDGRYWVATMADCARLEAQGYQWAD